MEESHACPWCGASRASTIKKGFRKTKTMGTRRVRFCKACGRKFTPAKQEVIRADPPEENKTNTPPEIPGSAPEPAAPSEDRAV